MPSYSNNPTVKQNASIKHVPVTMQDKPGHSPAEKSCTDKAQKTIYQAPRTKTVSAKLYWAGRRKLQLQLKSLPAIRIQHCGD